MTLRRIVRCALPVGLGLVGFVRPASGQHLVLRAGTEVRLTWESVDQGAPDWIAGRLEEPAWGGTLLMTPAGRTEPTTVRLDASSRLQIRAGRESNPRVGALVGAGIGAAVGGLFFADNFGAPGDGRTLFGTSSAIVGIGAAGALAGVAVATRLGRTRWVEVPLVQGVVRMPPLDRAPDRRFSPGRPQRWETFFATELDFAAFFQAYARVLDPIEGLWDAPGGGRVAVIRDFRYEGYDYVMVDLSDEIDPNPTRGGDIIAGLRTAGPAGRWEMVFTTGSVELPGQPAAAVREGPMLISNGTRGSARWIKAYP